MIFPKGEALYEQLSLSFTRLDAMLETLRSDRFTGYVRLTAPDYVGMVLLAGGEVASAIEEVGGQRRNSASALDGILARGADRAGTLGVFRLPPEITQLLSHFLHCEVLYRDLTSDLTSLGRLLGGLQGRRHSGYIEVRLLKSQDAATLFLWEGNLLETCLHRQGQLATGPAAQAELLRLAGAEGAVFTVYRTPPPRSTPEAKPAETAGRPEELGLWGEVLRGLEAAADGTAKPGSFLAAFRRAAVELAATFPFLDPFAAELEYRDGRLRYEGPEPVSSLHPGLCRCLAQCLRALAASPGGRDLPGRLAAAAQALKKRHGARLAELGLAEALPELFGAEGR